MSFNIHFVTAAVREIGPGGGSDAGHWVLGADGKLHWQPGWNPDDIQELTRAIAILRYASLLRERGLGDTLIRETLGPVQKQLTNQMKNGGVLVIG